jgi:mevalonate kinase
MVPEKYKQVWENGVKTGNYSLKLCGSGGGGYILGFTSNYNMAEVYFRDMGEKLIPVFKNS